MQFWAEFSNGLVHWSIRMIRAKNYKTVTKFVKVMPRIMRPLFSRTRCISALFNDLVSLAFGNNVKDDVIDPICRHWTTVANYCSAVSAELYLYPLQAHIASRNFLGRGNLGARQRPPCSLSWVCAWSTDVAVEGPSTQTTATLVILFKVRSRRMPTCSSSACTHVHSLIDC